MSQGNLGTQFPPVMLHLKLDNELASRWADGHVAAAQLWEDFAKYVYLPRRRDAEVRRFADAIPGSGRKLWALHAGVRDGRLGP